MLSRAKQIPKALSNVARRFERKMSSPIDMTNDDEWQARYEHEIGLSEYTASRIVRMFRSHIRDDDHRELAHQMLAESIVLQAMRVSDYIAIREWGFKRILPPPNRVTRLDSWRQQRETIARFLAGIRIRPDSALDIET